MSSMEARISSSLGLPSPNPTELSTSLNDFNGLINHFTTLTLTHTTTNPFASISNPTQPRFKPGPKSQTLLKNLTVFERAFIGAAGGGIAGAFTYACLHPLDTIKTKMQTKGASQIYKNTLDAVSQTFSTNGILGFYRGFSAVVVGSTASSAVYFGTCEFGVWFAKLCQLWVHVLNFRIDLKEQYVLMLLASHEGYNI
ncbi:Protein MITOFERRINLIKE 1 [Lathyrus oleraceus]|uniref:Protein MITOFERRINLIKE 1 n=1 Tax=Pisum sativum TaxID=3888 RepID=A0A9D5GWT0_PEA|nr:Protein MITOFERRINLIKE 1 [Pisum sativum]